MAKSFKIAVNPTFKATVEIPRSDSEKTLPVTFVFKTMGRRELAKMFDAWRKERLDLLEESSKNDMSLSEYTDREIVLEAQQVKQIVDGWGFDDEFNDENIEALVETCVSVTDAIVSKYNEAYTRARSGN